MINSRAEKAESFFRAGYNCAQSVALSFSDVIKSDEETIAKLTSGFGGGVGRLREVCGTVSGAVFVINSAFGYVFPKDIQSKTELYRIIQEFAEEFKKETGSIVCHELLGENAGSGHTPQERNKEYYKKRPCSKLCFLSAEILEKLLKKYGVIA